MSKINSEFFCTDAVTLARNLLGKYICRNFNGQVIKKLITETEAYFGEHDSACHAHKGKTERNKVMYEKAGLIYVYLVYGLHYMFNIVSGKINDPQAVLIRAIEGYNGPGKVTKYLKITKDFNNVDITKSNNIFIEEGIKDFKILSNKRIGISYATKEDQNKLWRFTLIN